MAENRFKPYMDSLTNTLSESKSALTAKNVEVPEETKLDDVPGLIGSIKTGNELKINITAEDYEDAIFTATHSDQETKATTTIYNNSGTLTVPKGGIYSVSNNQDEQTQEAELIDNVDLTFFKFRATIKVTLAQELVGETITCTLESDTKEQKAESTEVTFEVKKKGNWKIGVKDNTYISQTVNVENAQEYTTSLTVDPARVPTITVRSKEEDNGKTIKCTKSETVLQKVLQDRQCTFILPETGSWKITCDDYPEITKTVNVSEAKAYRCALRASIFGVKITESESDSERRVTYTDDAIEMTPVKVTTTDGSVDYGEWKDTWIFEKVYPCMVKTNGTIGYKLNPDDQTKKAEGGASEISSTSYDGNAMVCVEKFYTKLSMDGEDECIQISDEQEEGFEPIGFIREDGSEADCFFMPMFMGSFDDGSKLRSLSGQDIKYSTSWTDFRTAAQKNGKNYDIETWAMNQAFQTFYYILLKNCNPKKALGDGRVYNDANNKKTGVLANKGAIAYDPTTKATKFLWVEDYTSNYSGGMLRFEAGIVSQNNKIYVKMKPPYASDSVSTYTEVTDHVASTGKYISKMKCDNKYGRYGVAYEGTDSTYEASYWYTNTSSTLYISFRGITYGVAGRYFLNTPSDTLGINGAALSLLPPA